MTTSDFTITFPVDQTREEVFNAINNVRGWWSETIEGSTEKLNDEFIYRHKELHYSKQQLIEVVPNKKVVWIVTDSSLSFIENKSEWTGTKISFEIFEKDNKAQMRFIHHGLVPQCQCFEACFNGWSYYISDSLLPLITTGKGQPDPIEEAAAAHSEL